MVLGRRHETWGGHDQWPAAAHEERRPPQG
jgi:hypothetical protein